jgi:drug/metabolite transporter (DMT)-like permease
MHRNYPKPIVAAVLALVYPGIGHLYLKRWLRAVFWFVVIFTGTVIFIPKGAFDESILDGAKSIPAVDLILFVAIYIGSSLDAYRLAKQERSSE